VYPKVLGWKLMLLLCQQCVPKADLLDFVLAFFRKHILRKNDPGRAEMAAIASECARSLDHQLEILSPADREALGFAPLITNPNAGKNQIRYQDLNS
jgi:hypothetical protein